MFESIELTGLYYFYWYCQIRISLPQRGQISNHATFQDQEFAVLKSYKF